MFEKRLKLMCSSLALAQPASVVQSGLRIFLFGVVKTKLAAVLVHPGRSSSLKKSLFLKNHRKLALIAFRARCLTLLRCAN